MADPYRPDPRPTGLNTPDNPYYRRDRNVRVAREEESPLQFTGEAPTPVGTHALLIGTQGGAYGFADGVFGDITPTTVGGLEIAYLQEAADILRLGLVGDVQIPDVTTVTVLGKWDGAVLVEMTWSPGVSAYVSAPSPGLEDFLSANVGQTVQLDLTPVVLEDAVIAFLAGTLGFYLKPDDLTTMFQDTAMTIPVTADGQPVARVVGKGGTAPGAYQNGTVAQQPIYAAPGRMLADGADDFIAGPTPWAFPTMPCFFMCMDIEVVALPASSTRGILAFGNNTGGTFVLTVSSTGRLQISSLIITPAPPLSNAAPAPVLSNGVRRVLTILCDWVVEGRHEIRLDGVVVSSIVNGPGAIPAPGGVNRHRIMSNNGTTPSAVNAKIGRYVMSDKLPTEQERQDIEAWVGELF
jgi:hypothetical protein